MTGEVDRSTIGVLFPVNMGNRGQNVLSIAGVFEKLRRASESVEYICYHKRISGNFVFRHKGNADDVAKAVPVAESTLGLQCVACRMDDLARAEAAVPGDAVVVNGSVLVRRGGIRWRVVLVVLSEDVPPPQRAMGLISSRVESIAWPSARTVLCLYNRPDPRGDVGDVTQAVLRTISAPERGIRGSGRAMSVIRDLLSGRYVCTD
jgi:hypothetical protein